MRQHFTPKQRGTMIYGVLCLVLLLVALQLWLLSATMNAYLGGDESVIWPAALASTVCFLFNARLLYFVGTMKEPTKVKSSQPDAHMPLIDGGSACATLVEELL